MQFASEWPRLPVQVQVLAAPVSLSVFLTGTSRHIMDSSVAIGRICQACSIFGFVAKSIWAAACAFRRNMAVDKACGAVGEDAASAFAGLFKLLESGCYMDSRGHRKRIKNDTPKLMYAEGISKYQKALLADMKVRIRAVCGTQEVRTTIGRIGFWASIVYGNGIFMTVSLGERHNYLVIRLSRYSVWDPYVAASAHRDEQAWVGCDAPSLEADSSHAFNVHALGYELCRRSEAKDPLCCANVSFVQVRKLLAAVVGIRMCPQCLHCAFSVEPCQDSLGSSAELMGHSVGRVGALLGAVEAQKSNGSLHLHFKFIVQCSRQFESLKDIAEFIANGLVDLIEFKEYVSSIRVESYHDLERHNEEKHYIEKEWPTFKEDITNEECIWGNLQLCRLPELVRLEVSKVPTERLASSCTLAVSTQVSASLGVKDVTFHKGAQEIYVGSIAASSSASSDPTQVCASLRVKDVFFSTRSRKKSHLPQLQHLQLVWRILGRFRRVCEFKLLSFTRPRKKFLLAQV